jgi:hypothetical protein
MIVHSGKIVVLPHTLLRISLVVVRPPQFLGRSRHLGEVPSIYLIFPVYLFGYIGERICLALR